MLRALTRIKHVLPPFGKHADYLFHRSNIAHKQVRFGLSCEDLALGGAHRVQAHIEAYLATSLMDVLDYPIASSLLPLEVMEVDAVPLQIKHVGLEPGDALAVPLID